MVPTTPSTTTQEDTMAGLIGKIAAYARTPAGQRVIRT